MKCPHDPSVSDAKVIPVFSALFCLDFLWEVTYASLSMQAKLRR